MAKRTVKDLDVAGKRVIVRCDFNVPRKMEKLQMTTVLFRLYLQSNIWLENKARDKS